MSRSKSVMRPLIALTISVVCLVALSGCGSKVTAENYGKVKEGQTEAQVVEILGTPTSSETQSGPLGSGSKKVWKDGDKTITVGLLNGKVIIAEKSGF